MNNMLVAIEPTEEGTHIWHVASQVAKAHKLSPVVANVIEPAIHVYADLNFTPLLECATDWQNALTKEHVAFFQDAAFCLKDNKDSIRVIEGNPAYEISRLADKPNRRDILVHASRSKLDRRTFWKYLFSQRDWQPIASILLSLGYI